MMLSFVFVIIAAYLALTVAEAEQTPAERAQKLLSRMNLDEKISLLHGYEAASEYIGFVKGIDRLGVPSIRLQDGPQGLRSPAHPGTSTAWPAMINLGSTWDTNMCYEMGVSMGQEFYGKGANVQLGPAMNLARIPLNGRVMEYISGGDGYLGSMLVAPVIKGIQSNKVIANAKHFAMNNQETDRATINEIVDERTRFELYYEAFKGAVDAGVGSFMCSYNKINSFWSCENPQTLGDLKNTLGFRGWVMSDWAATHSTSIESGLDQEMPSGVYMGAALQKKVRDGEIPESAVDASVLRIITPMIEIGVMDDTNSNEISSDVRTPEHAQLARSIAAASHVLLQNNRDTLPLRKTPAGGVGSSSSGGGGGASLKIALIGKMARQPIVGGGGSGEVFPAKVTTPYEGIMTALNMADQIVPLSVNCTTNPRKNVGFEQASCISFGPTTVDECSSRCATFNGCTEWSFALGHCIFAPTAKGIKPLPGATSGTCTKTQPTPQWQCNSDNVCLITSDGADIDAAKKLAAEADVTIIAIGTSCGEGNDRESLSFAQSQNGCQLEPAFSQDSLVEALAAVASRSVVAMTCPGACLTPWRASVDAILHGFFPGEVYGDALADVLFGVVNPSAKLPLTMPNIENEVLFTPEMYPGVNKVANYSEGLLIDYRWYTAKAVTPAFSFGHGLSYTTFGFADLAVADAGRTLTCTVTNTGSVAGAEVAQLYLVFPAEANTPPLQLKGFVKTALLQPGASQSITFSLRDRDVSVWDVGLHAFRVVQGEFGARVGSSSADLRLSAVLSIA